MQWLEQHVGEALLAVVVAIMGFFGRRELARLDQKMDKTDFEAILKRLDEHIADDKELRRELGERFDRFADVLTETKVEIAKIVGRLEQ